MLESAKVGEFLEIRFSDEIWDQVNVWQLKKSLDANQFAKGQWGYLRSQFFEICSEKNEFKFLKVEEREEVRPRQRLLLNQMKGKTSF